MICSIPGIWILSKLLSCKFCVVRHTAWQPLHWKQQFTTDNYFCTQTANSARYVTHSFTCMLSSVAKTTDFSMKNLVFCSLLLPEDPSHITDYHIFSVFRTTSSSFVQNQSETLSFMQIFHVVFQTIDQSQHFSQVTRLESRTQVPCTLVF